MKRIRPEVRKMFIAKHGREAWNDAKQLIFAVCGQQVMDQRKAGRN